MDRLLKARTAAKSWTTRAANKIEELLARQKPPATVSELAYALEELDKRLSKLEEVQS